MKYSFTYGDSVKTLEVNTNKVNLADHLGDYHQGEIFAVKIDVADKQGRLIRESAPRIFAVVRPLADSDSHDGE